MTTLLVLTAGQSDVQLVVDGVRRELRKERCAALHDELEQRASKWRIVDSPDSKTEPPVEQLPEGELLLCTPKLDAVVRDVVPTSALVLETRRDANAAPGDPRFAGAVLEARLKDKGVETIRRVAYLAGTERLEDRAQPRDAVIRREVVSRLEQAVRECLETVTPSRIVVATSGGFPAVSNLVEEIVRLHASVPVDALEVADGARANPPSADRAVARTSIPEPLISFQARRRALELIAKGNLLGAWAIAEPLHEHEVEHTWTRVMEWLRRFASSLPMAEGCELPVLTHKRMAVRTALRVELALRAGDIPRAIHGTVAFFEAALWDHLGERATRHADAIKRRWFSLDPVPAEDLVRKGEPYESKQAGEEDRKRPFIRKETADGTDWYWIDDSEFCAIQLAKHYLKLDGLTKLGQAVSKDIRELRNDVAHNEPTPELMEDARRRMAEAKLWSGAGTFLSQQLVQDVLHELGALHPGSLCEELLRTVRLRLLAGPQP
mgnify:CR=1 FL=1